MRNSVILVDQIDRNIADGMVPRTAVIEAAMRRFRPIMLTALAAILAMIPLSRSVFFGRLIGSHFAHAAFSARAVYGVVQTGQRP